MRTRKQNMWAWIGAGVVLLVIFGVMNLCNVRFMPMRMAGDASELWAVRKEREKLLAQRYDVHFVLDRADAGKGKIWMPVYDRTDAETGAYYAGLFDFHDTGRAFDDYYLYEKGAEKLYVDRFSACLWYERPPQNAVLQPVGADAVAAKATRFAADCLPTVAHQKRTIRLQNGVYTVRLLSTFDGCLDYAFPFTLTYSAGGTLTGLTYYFLDYEQIDIVDLKTMEEAFFELPTDGLDEQGKNARIELKNCAFVYIYDESIIQPAYLFEGTLADGESFEYTVKAADYGQSE